MFSDASLSLARSVLALARAKSLKIVTAESCTGGLVAACLTEIPGSSDVVERGFFVYSNEAKHELLGVPIQLIAAHGAVSPEVARAMAQGARERVPGCLAVAVTGIAGPGGGSAEKPVGVVHLAVAGAEVLLDEVHHFGDIGRTQVRLRSVEAALALLRHAL